MGFCIRVTHSPYRSGGCRTRIGLQLLAQLEALAPPGPYRHRQPPRHTSLVLQKQWYRYLFLLNAKFRLIEDGITTVENFLLFHITQSVCLGSCPISKRNASFGLGVELSPLILRYVFKGQAAEQSYNVHLRLFTSHRLTKDHPLNCGCWTSVSQVDSC